MKTSQAFWTIVGLYVLMSALMIDHFDNKIRDLDNNSDIPLFQAAAKKEEVAIRLCLKRHAKNGVVELCDCIPCK